MSEINIDIGNMDIPELTVDDAILTLLFANINHPIVGRLIFVKEMFLLSRELSPSLIEKLNFFPSHYGPFSSIFANSIDKLIERKYIKVEYTINDFGDSLHRFTLTEKGAKIISNRFEKLPESLKNLIIKKRRIWDQLGYTGIIRLVYSKYPEFTINSKIKDKVF